MDSQLAAKEELLKKRPCVPGFWDYKRRKCQDSTASSDAESTKSPRCGHRCFGGHGTTADEPCHCPMANFKFSKLEQLFERFACRKSSSSLKSESTQDLSEGTPSSSQETAVTDTSNEKSGKYIFGLPFMPKDDQSISSVGESILAGQDASWNDAASLRTVVAAPEYKTTLSPESVRRSLCALLPTQEDADTIFSLTHGWTILGAAYRPSKELFVNQDPNTFALDMSAVAKENTLVIARTLLHLAICIWTMPPESNTSSLKSMWSPETAMQTYVSTVTNFVLSSDEQMCTFPGLETLQLLAIYQFSTSHLRQAWLTVRRALNLAHLMGIHRIFSQSPQSSTLPGCIGAATHLWYQLADMDRFISLHLRLPFASDDHPTPPNIPPLLVHRTHLHPICRQISDLDGTITPQTYVQALAIDEQLDAVMKSLSQPFWTIPKINPNNRCAQTADDIFRITTQIWHFELKTLLHLPFLLRARAEPRYEYSKVIALQAARNVICRWFALRQARATQTCTRVCDLPVFIATATITLDMLTEIGATKTAEERAAIRQTRGPDFAIVCRVVAEMDQLAGGSAREVFARRCGPVLKRLLWALDPRRLQGREVKVTLPYFGTVVIGGNGVVRQSTGNESAVGIGIGVEGGGEHKLPVFSFVSNSLWPGGEGDGNGNSEEGFDVMLFEGLEDLDVEGNWVF